MTHRSGVRIDAFRLASLFILLLTALSACTQNPTPPTTQNAIKIGISLSLQGDFSADGVPTKQGYQLWAKEVNAHGGLLGRQVQLDILDDASKPEQTATNYQTLINRDHVDLLMGPFADDFSVAAGRIAKRYGYALVDGTGNAPSTYQQGLNNLFCVSLPGDKYLSSFVVYVLAMPEQIRPKTVAFATSDDPFTKSQVDTARQGLENGGIKTTVYSLFPQETTDYTPIALKLIHSRPQVVVIGSTGLPSYSPFIQVFKQQQFNPQMVIGTAGPDQGDQFVQAVGKKSTEGQLVPNGGWYPGAKTFQNDTFVPGFDAMFHTSADGISSDSVQSFSVGQVLQQAVTKIHSLSQAALITELHTGTFNSLQGLVRFSSDGRNTVAIPYLFQWQGGKLVVVYPPNAQQANVEFPKPAWH